MKSGNIKKNSKEILFIFYAYLFYFNYLFFNIFFA